MCVHIRRVQTSKCTSSHTHTLAPQPSLQEEEEEEDEEEEEEEPPYAFVSLVVGRPVGVLLSFSFFPL